ncbi:nicotinate-nucleotide adenylyltransferase [Methyloradius palustris]|uniref:Probable nicotinate-nucleotide adenylyltransferase n=1 Tax=Methyloradius palustris TaxID=2778876 RepID=A0A8D5GFI7_9PROT|nr:nicotinate-nucleotide adenylyltransferase [Methyloradius palustris]BCM25794.1 putative nicotinate-nucleotide adenylyltransferase [Methyloradius palustris]
MAERVLIGMMGGTFDPIHFGHLRMAQEISDLLALSRVHFIPSATPPHKTQTTVSAKHRTAMVNLAIADNPQFKLDLRELEREGASYSIDTLHSLRAELGDEVSICLLLGSDAFIKLNTWHRWNELLNVCHIVLVQRPHTNIQEALPEELQAVLHNHYSEHIEDLSLTPSGHITMQPITALDISATAIREDIKHGRSLRYLMPEPVISYIQSNQLYI